MYTTWDELKTACQKCENCNLCKTRTNVVVRQGNENAEVLFIGEGPGQNEDLQGKPFVGRSGNLLTDMLREVGLERDKNFYITNIVKCRPPENRDPLPEEQSQCLAWLGEQVHLLKPKIIVCVGRISAQKLISKDFRVTIDHGKFYKRNDIVYMGTFHPAAILRNPNNKPLAQNDFLRLRDVILKICPSTYEK
ncbi:Type-4 uracil-DNA glycosylase [bioreactor metagenome]|uniref:Type-4 uracil-DNA glycosylase n=1 Tax=bioreactor metagenome TaxID=1076179 RepID=A0A645DWL0_9ZZZZ